MMTYQNITLIGGGTLGSQIAYMAAYHGKEVTIWGRSEASLDRAKKRVARWQAAVQDYFHSSDAKAEQAKAHLTYTTNLKEALQGADLVIEALPENPQVKQDFYRQFAQLADPKTVIATNSSTMMPTKLADATGRPDKFLAYHFANTIWQGNTAEIMPGQKTAKDLPATFVELSKEIGMVPIMVNKEQPGYVLNSLLVPFLDAGTDLWVRGVADPQTIDKTWMIATASPQGPFGIMDTVGMKTVYEINRSNPDEAHQAAAKKIKHMIDEGKLGVETGQGFYSYPNPAYRQADFLK